MTVYAIWEEAKEDKEEQLETEEPVGEPDVIDEQVETGTDVEVINDIEEDEEDVAGEEKVA